MTTKHKVVIGGTITLLLGIIALQLIQVFMLKAEIKFCEDQIHIFNEMVKSSMKEKPEDIIGFLEYTINYYPSGTKQRTGSSLDKIVEQERQESIQKIIDLLKMKTNDDLGNDPNSWIEKYKNKS